MNSLKIKHLELLERLSISSLASPPDSPAVGDIYYDSTLGKFQFYQHPAGGSGAWHTLGVDELAHQNILVGGVDGKPAALDTSLHGDITVDPIAGLTIKAGVINNDDISASAGIALSKLAALSQTNRALVSSSSGEITESAVTTTELDYVHSVTSPIQTQFNNLTSAQQAGLGYYKQQASATPYVVTDANRYIIIGGLVSQQVILPLTAGKPVGYTVRVCCSTTGGVTVVSNSSELDPSKTFGTLSCSTSDGGVRYIGDVFDFIVKAPGGATDQWDAIRVQNFSTVASSANSLVKRDTSGVAYVSQVVLAGDPTAGMQAATKQYVDNHSGSASVALDGTFRIKNTAFNDKQMAFDASAITGGTTKTLKMPDANVDLAALDNSNIAAVAGIVYSKLSLADSIKNSDISSNSADKISYSKLDLGTSIVNADIATGAAIAYGKLALNASILSSDIAASGIDYAKLNLTNSIQNTDLAGSIAYGKLSLTNSIQNADLAGSIAYSKLSLSDAIKNSDISSNSADKIAESKLDLAYTTSALHTAITDEAAARDVADVTFLKLDGSRSMSGALAMSAHKITGLLAGTENTDAATYGQLAGFVAGAVWLSPVLDVNLIDATQATGAFTGANSDTYIAAATAGTWTAGHVYQWNGTGWTDILDRPVALGDRFIVSGETNTLAAGTGLSGKDDQIVTVTGATPGSMTFDAMVPSTNSAVYCNNPLSHHSGHQYNYNGAQWNEFGGLDAVSAGIGLYLDGNSLNINLGAGIAQLPSDEVGVDVHGSSGLMLTLDGLTPDTSVGGAASSDAQLSVKLDGSTLAKSSSGLKVANGGIADSQIASGAAIAVNKLAAVAPSMALISDSSGFISASANVSATELGYLDGVTSSIQTQLNDIVSATVTAGYGLEKVGTAIRIADAAASNGIAISSGAFTVQVDDETTQISANKVVVKKDSVGGIISTGSGIKVNVGTTTGLYMAGNVVAVKIASTLGLQSDSNGVGIKLNGTSLVTDTSGLRVNATAFPSQFVPSNNNSFDLGSITKSWANVFAKTVDAGSTDLTLTGANVVLGAAKTLRTSDLTNFMEEEYFDSVAVPAGSNIISEFTFSAFSGVTVEYLAHDDTSGATRNGSIRLAFDGAVVSIIDLYTETADCELVWTAAVSGGSVQLTATKGVSAATMRCLVKRLRA